VLPIIAEIQKSGASTLRAIADALNARGMPAPRGGRWHAMSVRNMLPASPIEPAAVLVSRPPWKGGGFSQTGRRLRRAWQSRRIDLISVGWLTHSAPIPDVGLNYLA